MCNRPKDLVPLFILFAVFFGIIATTVSGCGQATPNSAQQNDSTDQSPKFTGHGVSKDLKPVTEKSAGKADRVPMEFDPEYLFHDDFFVDQNAVGAADIDTFLEESPYDGNSPLADRTFTQTGTSGSLTAGQTISSAAKNEGINPILLLARLQVEGALISKEATDRELKFAFGCGCYDHESGCRDAYAGFHNQIECAAETLREGFEASTSEDIHSEWIPGEATQTHDGVRIVPENRATAAMYHYTPWVLPGRGGNWLVWNITQKFVKHFQDLGILDDSKHPWIGSPCSDRSDCIFSYHNSFGECYRPETATGRAQKGFCTLGCDGYCPDRKHRRTTFCISRYSGLGGICAVKADEKTCGEVPGTVPLERERYVNQSNAPEDTAEVCANL